MKFAIRAGAVRASFLCVWIDPHVINRSMKRARDVRDQLEGLMERVEIEMTSNLHDLVAIQKVSAHTYQLK